MSKKFTFIDLFAGIGGFHTAMHGVGGKCVFASEWDKYARISYEENYKDMEPSLFAKDEEGNYLYFNEDVTQVIPEKIPAFDVCCGGFPCQPFSIAGLRRGFEDTRGTLFFNIANIVKQKIDTGTPPKVLFLENVKGLKTHMKGDTLKTILATLEELGYAYNYDVLNAKYFGVPQNRERIYIVAFKNENHANEFEFPVPVELTQKLSDIIDFDSKFDDKYYYTAGKYKRDIYEKLLEAIDDDKAIYQWRRTYVRKNKSGVVPTLTAGQGEGGHNVCIVKTKYGIRKMTPRECFNAQGFSKDFKLPEKMSDSRLYKQSGNSVCVPVIKRIAEKIIQVIDNH